MKIYRATSGENAIKISVRENEQGNADYQIDRYIAEMFGGNNDDYFIHSSRIQQDATKTRVFKIMLVEDKDTVKHSVFFELIKENNDNKTGPKNFTAKSRYI